MRRYFNTEGRCRQDIHYMVRLEQRLEKIKREYIDFGKYFVMNRGRQYGKTTTLMALAEYLKEDYIVLAMDFQMMSTANFADEQTFVQAFAKMFVAAFDKRNIGNQEELQQSLLQLADNDKNSSFIFKSPTFTNFLVKQFTKQRNKIWISCCICINRLRYCLYIHSCMLICFIFQQHCCNLLYRKIHFNTKTCRNIPWTIILMFFFRTQL